MLDKKYKALIERFPLTPIKGDKHLDEAHHVAQSLMLRKVALEPLEEDYLEVLLDEISKYEKKHHALKLAELSPGELLLSFMDEHRLKQVDIAKILSVSSGVANELVKGKRELTKEHCARLGAHFSVSPALFLPKVTA